MPQWAGFSPKSLAVLPPGCYDSRLLKNGSGDPRTRRRKQFEETAPSRLTTSAIRVGMGHVRYL